MVSPLDDRVVLRTIAFAFGPGCAVYVGGRQQSPSDEDWDVYLRFLEAHGVRGPRPRALVLERGFGPTLRQRQMMHAVVGNRDVRAAVLTDATFARGVVRLVALVSPGFRAFPVEDLGGALRHLDVPEAEHAIYARLLESLVTELDRGSIPPSKEPTKAARD
ncbi:MAG TPA: hypothetical protein VHE30_13775 [Polyangiaceae bacterium]|nr:hypothetical protein [Polyangiaceae bacterium]